MGITGFGCSHRGFPDVIVMRCLCVCVSVELMDDVLQGPIGYMPIPNNTTCSCTQFSQNSNKRTANPFYPSNVCMDHGYIDYHGSLNHSSIKPYIDGALLLRNPVRFIIVVERFLGEISIYRFAYESLGIDE